MSSVLNHLKKIGNNWKLKLLAFGLAVLLWVVVTADQPTTGWFSVPLDVVVTDPNYRLDAEQLPDDVEVRFVGPGREMFDLALRRPTLRLAVNDIEDEVEARTLDPRMVQLPGQMSVNALDVRPTSLQLEFTRIDSREVPVIPAVSSAFGEEWAIVDTLTTDPETVRITGPAREVSRLEAIPTEAFALTLTDTIVDREIALDTTLFSGIQLSSRTVRVTGRVDRVVERTLTNIGIDVGPGIEILPTTTTITLIGPGSVVRELSPDLFRVVVSIDEIPTRIPTGGVTVPLRTDGLRPGVEAQLSPPQVRLFPAGQRDTVATPSVIPGRSPTINTLPPLQ